MADSNPPNPARFSLRTLFVATTFLVMAIAIVLLSLELIPLRAEVQRLRDEAGYLTIDDPTQVHAIELETSSPLLWKWKVHVPDSANSIGAKAIVGEIPAQGDEPDLSPNFSLNGNEPVLAFVTAKIFKDLNDRWIVETSIELNGASTYSRNQLDDDQISKLRTLIDTTSSSVGIRNYTHSASLNEAIILRRKRFVGPNTNLETAGSGILIWIYVSGDQ